MKASYTNYIFDALKDRGPVTLGPWGSHAYRSDPKRFMMVLSRYKFVSKMLAGKRHVLEAGCGDGYGAPVVLQEVYSFVGVDHEPEVIKSAKAEGATFFEHDIMECPVPGVFDAAYSLDVIEHVTDSARFLDNICSSLSKDGVLIVGTPNITAHQYASTGSKAGHINLQSAQSLKALMADRFKNVFLFSMNDEVVHTGFSEMAHYLLCMGVGRK